MGVLAALARRARIAPARCAAIQIARRGLGDTVRSPPLSDFPAQTKLALDFFQKGAVSYSEYKAQRSAVRLFAFTGTIAFCVGGLFLNPPKSSYWVRYSPRFLPSFLMGCFANSSPPLFVSTKVEGDDVPTIASELITFRRREGASGSDSEDDH